MSNFLKRTFILAIILCAFIGILYFANGSVQFSMQCANSRCLVAASSSLMSTMIGLSLLVFAALFPQKKIEVVNTGRVGIWRRILSGFIDCLVVVTISIPVLAFLVLLTEQQATQEFAWRFIRDFTRNTDGPVFIGAGVVNLLSFFIYFYCFAKFQKATLGQLVMGYSIFPNTEHEKAPRYFVRTLALFVTMVTCVISIPISWFVTCIQTSGGKTYWWDRVGHTSAKKVHF